MPKLNSAFRASHFASVAAAAIVGVVLERIRARRSYALIERAPGFKAWRMSKWVKHAGRIETQGLVGTDAASSIADQTAQALANLDAILTEAGSSRDKLLSVTIYLRDIERDFEGMNGVYDSWLGTDKPTRACVQDGARLPACEQHHRLFERRKAHLFHACVSQLKTVLLERGCQLPAERGEHP